MSEPVPSGVYGHISDTAYHQDRHSLSSSGARLLLPPSCPAKFREAMDRPRKPKREFDFGHVAHHLILGKGAEFAILDPEVHGMKGDGTVAANPRATAAWKAAEAEARDRDLVPIHVDDYRKAQAMAAKVHAHPVAGPMFVDGQAEVSLYADDPVTGVQLRARPDWMTGAAYDPNRLWIVDVKTTTTEHPDEFARKATGFGYHVQAAFYLRVARLLGMDAEADPMFVFVAVEKEPPHLVSVVAYDEESLAEGDRLTRQAIDLYARCVADQDWPSYTGTDAIVPISLPRWALRDGIQADADSLITELEGIYQ